MQFLIRILLFVFLIFVIEFYFIRKFNNSINILLDRKLPGKVKTITKIILYLLNIYPVFLVIDWSYAEITGTPVFIPQNYFFDFLIIYPFWSFIFLAIQTSLLFLLIELLKLFLIPVHKKNKQRIKIIEAWIVLASIICFFIYIPIRETYDYFSVEVRNVVFKKPGLAAGLNNFKFYNIGYPC